MLTRINKPPVEQGGELKSATKGLAVGVMTGVLPVTSDVNVKGESELVPIFPVLLFLANTTNCRFPPCSVGVKTNVGVTL